jgi:hypothetical protein
LIKFKAALFKRTLTIPECFCFDPDQRTIRDFCSGGDGGGGYFDFQFAVPVEV